MKPCPALPVLPAFLALLALSCDPSLGAPPDYASMFPRDHLPLFDLTVSGADWVRLLVQPDEYVPAALRIDGADYSRVGLRLMGTKRRPKRSLRLRFDAFDASGRYHGVKRINLRAAPDDPTLVREVLALRLLTQAGVPAPRAALAEVVLNGNLGVYTLVEQIDRKFLADRFGEKDGDLWQIEANLAYAGDRIEDYDPIRYELDSEGGDPRYLLTLVQALRGEGAPLRARLETVLDVPGLLRWIAAQSFFVSLNSYLGTAQNLRLYRDLSGRFRPIGWQLDDAFGNYHGVACTFGADELLALDPLHPTCGGDRPLVDRVLSDPGLFGELRAVLRELCEGPFAPAAIEPEIERLRLLVSKAAGRDALMEFTFEQFEAAFEGDLPPSDNPLRVLGLVPFVRARALVCARLGG